MVGNTSARLISFSRSEPSSSSAINNLALFSLCMGQWLIMLPPVTETSSMMQTLTPDGLEPFPTLKVTLGLLQKVWQTLCSKNQLYLIALNPWVTQVQVCPQPWKLMAWSESVVPSNLSAPSSQRIIRREKWGRMSYHLGRLELLQQRFSALGTLRYVGPNSQNSPASLELKSTHPKVPKAEKHCPTV